MRNHPFLDAAFLPAWSTLQAEHIVPDITLAVERAEAAIAAIAGSDLTQLTYASTFLALERATEELNVAWPRWDICKRWLMPRPCAKPTT